MENTRQNNDETTAELVETNTDGTGADVVVEQAAHESAAEEVASSAAGAGSVNDSGVAEDNTTAAADKPAENGGALAGSAGIISSDTTPSTAPIDTAQQPSVAGVAPVIAGGTNNKRKMLWLVLVLVALIAGVVAYVLMSGILRPIVTTVDRQTAPVARVGAELIIADGTVQISLDNKSWAGAKIADQLSQGHYVRALDGSRAVIALDDGSAIRIDSGSVVKLDSLDSKNIVITNTQGSVYTRVVKSDRQFSVRVADETYVAMGTAYMTRNTSDKQGVEVYESKVKLTHAKLETPEGKYYYTKSSNADQTNKLTDLTVDAIKQDSFLAWNYQQDKSNDEFKDKLGYLTKLDESSPTAQAPNPPTSQPAAGLVLSGTQYATGVKLNWSVNGLSVTKGFKVVKGLSANPTYGKDSASYVSDSNARSYSWTIKDGKTYHFRVCVYTGDGCSSYSNDITVAAPKVAGSEGQAPSGVLSLTSTGGKNVSWTLDGSAPSGYKLVWSKSANPVYPGSDYEYYGSESTKSGTIGAKEAGTYYVRVCMYNTSGSGDKCMNYSNQLTISVQ